MNTIQKPFVKGYKYRFYPNKDQIELLNQTFGCCRYVYNKALAETISEYEEYKAFKSVLSNTSTLVKP